MLQDVAGSGVAGVDVHNSPGGSGVAGASASRLGMTGLPLAGLAAVTVALLAGAGDHGDLPASSMPATLGPTSDTDGQLRAGNPSMLVALRVTAYSS